MSLPSGQRYWTVLDEDLQVVGVADEYLRHLRFGRDAAESTTKAYAHSIALFLRWCARSGRSWQAGVEGFALFMTWLAHARSSVDDAASVVVAGPGVAAVRCSSRINGVLTAVRGMVVHAVATGHGAARLVSMLYEVADDRDLPVEARGEDGRYGVADAGPASAAGTGDDGRSGQRRADRRAAAGVPVGAGPADRVADGAGRVAPRGGVRAAAQRCASTGGFAPAGLRGGAGASACGAPRGNPNEAWAKSRRQRVVPLDFLVVQLFDVYEFERMRVTGAADSDFVFVNLFRGRIGAPMRPDAIAELMAAASRRAGLDAAVRPHQLRHAYGSNVVDAGAGIDVVADLLGHAAVSSSQVYLHPDSSRLRAAVDAVPSPRELGAVRR